MIIPDNGRPFRRTKCPGCGMPVLYQDTDVYRMRISSTGTDRIVEGFISCCLCGNTIKVGELEKKQEK